VYKLSVIIGIQIDISYKHTSILYIVQSYLLLVILEHFNMLILVI